MRAAIALDGPFRGAGQVAPELALVLDPRLGLASKFVLFLLFDLREVRPHRVSRARHRAVIETQKAVQNRLKKRRATTKTHHAAGSRHRDDVVRWNEAFCSLFLVTFGNFWLTIQNTTNRHVSNAFDLLAVFISFPLVRAAAAAAAVLLVLLVNDSEYSQSARQ